jgi:hypothetical protein
MTSKSKPMDELVDSPLYGPTFERFVAASDAKEKCAQAVGKVAQEIGASSLLDLGAGDGTLTRMLAPFFETIIAVEGRKGCEAALLRIPNTSTIIARMEDVVPPRKMDVILMSYSLPGVPSERRGPFLRSLLESLTPRGQILLVTHQDGCPGDAYAGHVSEALGIARSGGTAGHRQEIRGAGLDVELVASFDTFVWANDLASLFDTLEFFFLGHTEAYHASRAAFEGVLRTLAEPLPDGRTGIRLVESLFKLTSPASSAGPSEPARGG